MQPQRSNNPAAAEGQLRKAPKCSMYAGVANHRAAGRLNAADAATGWVNEPAKKQPRATQQPRITQ
jgi:hypothetical protein